jgi:hypothetical protein
MAADTRAPAAEGPLPALPAGEAELAALRSRHGLRPLRDEEEGLGLEQVPPGVYGFTYSPATEATPLFKERRFKNYEVHKLADGSVFLLGFVQPHERAALEARREPVTLRLKPDPAGESTHLVALPLAGIGRVREHSQRSGEGLELTIEPPGRPN